MLASADVPLGTPLMRVDPGAVTRRVEAIRQVASATVSEDWPDHPHDRGHRACSPSWPCGWRAATSPGLRPTGVIVSYPKLKPRAPPLFITTLSGSALRGDRGVAAGRRRAAGAYAGACPAVTTVAVAPLRQAARGRRASR